MESSCRRLWPSIHRVSMFTPDDCREILARGESLEGWQDAPVLHEGGSVLRPKKRRALRIHVAGDEADARALAAFAPHVAKVERVVRDLDQRYFGLGVGAIQDAQLVRYPEGGHYDWHPDALDHAFRKLTALCYLTDRASDDVRGGETSFAPRPLSWLLLRRPLRRASAAWTSWLPTLQRPERGEMLVFDATVPHRAHPVRAGRKEVLNIWFS